MLSDGVRTLAVYQAPQIHFPVTTKLLGALGQLSSFETRGTESLSRGYFAWIVS